MLNLLGQQRQVGVAKAIDGCSGVSGRPACVSAFETRYESVRPPNDSPLKRVGDAEGLLERARHGAQPGAPAQQQGAVDIKQDQCRFHRILIRYELLLTRKPAECG